MTMAVSLEEEIRLLINDLPLDTINSLTEVLATGPAGEWAVLKRQAQAVAANAHYREKVRHFIERWHLLSPEITPQIMAMVIGVAAHCLEVTRKEQKLELVWTGPSSGQPLRRTDQVLRQLIDGADHELTIVAFAIYKIEEIKAALIRAAERGVRLVIIVEAPEESAGKVTYDGLFALGPQVQERAEIYRWPLEKRPLDDKGRHGSLHAKCVVADGVSVFISSANLTDYAMTLNIEMGLLIQGGPLPGQVATHFKRLIEGSSLVKIQTK